MTDKQKIADLTERLAVAEAALSAAWTDIGQWLQLARHQREILKPEPGMKCHPALPTEAGIESSLRVKSQISLALAEMPVK